MKSFTITDIRSWEPWYNPNKYLDETWQGNALDILKHADIPAKDKLRVVLRKELLSDKILRLFAVSCARSVEHLMNDERSIDAINVAEQYALGTATKEELNAAYSTARVAAAADADADASADAAAAAYAAERKYQIIMLIELLNKGGNL